eukprot:15063202-Alexandrium_andersonii.AAC.1
MTARREALPRASRQPRRSFPRPGPSPRRQPRRNSRSSSPAHGPSHRSEPPDVDYAAAAAKSTATAPFP